MATRKLNGYESDQSPPSQEEQSKINEVRKSMGSIASKFPVTCSDESISRYLRARNWNTKKASKMLKDALKWRLENKPERIRWDDVANEARTGKLYIANYLDKRGRTIVIMRPGFENTTSTVGQIKYLVYSMEKAVFNLQPDQEQMVWLIDFRGWSMGTISLKATRETAYVLQDIYPERLGIGVLYNPPKIFESFWMVVKPFLETKTHKKMRFVYSDNPQSLKIMDELFDNEKLDSFFGGKSVEGFDFEAYSNRMRDQDHKMTDSRYSECPSPCIPAVISELQQSDTNSVSSSDDENSARGRVQNGVACNEVDAVKEQKI